MTDPPDPADDPHHEGASPGHVPDTVEVVANDETDAHRRRLQGDMVRGSLWTAVTALTGLPVTLLVNVVLARTLGADGLGQLGLLVAAYALASTAVNLGTSEATVQWLAAARARGDRAAEIDLVRACAGYHMIVEGPVLALVTIAVLWQRGPGAAIVAALAILTIQTLGTSTVVLTATARNALAAKVALFVSLAGQATTISVAVSSREAVATWAAQMAIAVLGPLIAFMRLEPHLRGAILRPRLPFHLPPGFRTYAGSACALALVGALVWGRSELFVLTAFGYVEDAGVFVVITGLAGQITVPMDSLMGPLLPVAAGLVAASPGLAAAALLRALRVCALLGAFTVSVAGPVTISLMVPLYGDDFAQGRAALAILVVVSCVQSASGPMMAFAFATRSAPALLRANLVCLAIDVALALALIPVIGLWGAVIAGAAAQIVSLVLLMRITRRTLSIGSWDLLLATRTFFVGATFGTAAALVCALPGLDAWLRGLLIVLGPALLVAALWTWPQLRLPRADADSIFTGMPDWMARTAEPVMTRLHLLQEQR